MKGFEPNYAIVDSARIGYCDFFRKLGPEFCLFDEQIGEPLLQTAPYLVPLGESTLGYTSWEDLPESRSALYLETTESLANLRRHLKKFLHVTTPDYKAYFFRYYDPRVFSISIPIMNIGQLRKFFGPIERFWVIADEPMRALDYVLFGESLGGQGLNALNG